MYRSLFLILFIFSFAGYSYSQEAREEIKISRKWQQEFVKAKDDYQKLDVDSAIERLARITAKNELFAEAWLLLGYCYHDLNQKKREFEAFDKVLSIDPAKYVQLLIQLAEIAYYWGDYNKAEEFLVRFEQPDAPIPPKHNQDYFDISARVDFALRELAKSLLGNEVIPVIGNDSKANYYFPSLTIDGEEVIFTKQQISNELGNSPGQEDLFSAGFDGKQFVGEEPIKGLINTAKNEGTQTLRYDGRLMFFTACSYPDSKGGCDIYYTLKEDKTWLPATNIGNPINTRYWESTPCLSPDGMTLFFSSNRPGGFGGMDIWVSKFVDGSGWQVPTNMGDVINSSGDELAPFIHSDGRTFYFASSGHIGMGQLDLFRSSSENGVEWLSPINLGYPVNTHKNEFGITIPGSGEYALFASDRDSADRREIFKYNIISEHKPNMISYVKGRVIDSLSHKSLEASLEIQEFSGNSIQIVNSDRITGAFTIALPRDNHYVMIVRSKGYYFHSESFHLSDSSKIVRDKLIIKLQALKPESKLILRNIFFEFDSAILSEKSNGEILQIVKLLFDNPGIRIEISGHTDSTGSEDYNQKLSYNRAKSLKDALIQKGVARNRIVIIGHGSLNPLTSNDTDTDRAMNRRTEIRVLK